MSDLTTVPLATARLALRSVELDDVPTLVELANDLEVARRLSRLPHPYGEADAVRFVTEISRQGAHWKVVERDASMVGIVGLNPPNSGTAELGYWYGRRFWGRGFATEAARRVVAYALEESGLEALVSGYFADNEASGHVLRKVGFVEQRRSPRRCEALDRDLPHVEMLLIRDGR